MNKRTILLGLLVIIVISIIGASTYFLKGKPEQERGSKFVFPGTTGKIPAQPTPIVPSQPEINTFDWKVYRNEKYGFEIKYPSDFTLQSTISPGVMAGSIVSFKLIANRYYTGTNLNEASVVIGARQDTKSLSHCLMPEPLSFYKKLVETKVINGVTFYKDVVQEGATGHLYEKISYRTIHNSICFEIALFIHSSNIGVFNPGTVLEFDRDAVLERLTQVLSTFKFLK